MEFLGLLGFAATGAASVFGYMKTRKFVRERLRFVDAAHTGSAPVVVGAVTAVGLAVLPIITVVPAVAIGFGVAMGVAHGSRDTRRQLLP